MKELALLVNPGLDQGFPRLSALPSLDATAARRRSDTEPGHRAAVRLLIEDGIDQLRTASPEYAKAARELLVLGPRTSTAETRRGKAGDVLGKTGATFKRHHERRVLGALAEAILLLDAETAEREKGTQRTVDVGWQTIQSTLYTMHREIESGFEPDIVVTMSGPGSFAAFLCLAMDPRDVPVVACTTFPNRPRKSPTHQVFSMAARDTTWHVIETTKWVVYLPRILAEFPPRARVLIFDDRVVSGNTQRKVRAVLEDEEYEVRSAAMIVSSKSSKKVDFHGITIDDDYALPWGSRRGRT